jgi:anti-sigma regulatory factor (Ser/Thr protein kinase)
MATLDHTTPGDNRHGPAAAPVERIFAAAPIAVPRARQFARETLAAWGLCHLSENASAVVSELVANAVREAKVLDGEVLVRISRSGQLFFLHVGDRSPARPPQPAPTAQGCPSEHGHGLWIAAELSWRLGWYVDPSGWKIVWAAFEVRNPRPDRASGRRDQSPSGAQAGAAA